MEPFKNDVFISYSRKDTPVADLICKAFDKAGITYFIDRQGIAGGLEFPAVLAQAIRESKVFLFLASKNSYESKFTQSEVIYAFNKKTKHDIIPYIIDDSEFPEDLAFTFSAINWRTLKHHPIDPVLVSDILSKLPPKEIKYVDINACPAMTGIEDGHEWVDLGLSVKWATCNIGASRPEEEGDFFAWGEVWPKDVYTGDNYKYFKITFLGKLKILKYNDDNKRLELCDDAAYVNWGKNWRIPTNEEFDELIANCTMERSIVNNVNGRLFTSKLNGNSIFLPAAGWCRYDCIDREFGYQSEAGDVGYYWSSSRNEEDNSQADHMFFFIEDDMDLDEFDNENERVMTTWRCHGLSVRPVLSAH